MFEKVFLFGAILVLVTGCTMPLAGADAIAVPMQPVVPPITIPSIEVPVLPNVPAIVPFPLTLPGLHERLGPSEHANTKHGEDAEVARRIIENVDSDCTIYECDTGFLRSCTSDWIVFAVQWMWADDEGVWNEGTAFTTSRDVATGYTDGTKPKHCRQVAGQFYLPDVHPAEPLGWVRWALSEVDG